jgi:signal transduction histidine kinase
MLFLRLDPRVSLLIKVVGFGLVAWTVIDASRWAPDTSRRGLAVSILFALCLLSALVWSRHSDSETGPSLDLYVMAAAGGALTQASPHSAAAAFVFVAVAAAGIRGGLVPAMRTAACGAVALAVAVIVWDGSALGLLAYALGFAATGLGTSNVRTLRLQAEQAELLLAQTQRSHEEQLRAARLEESARIAREIHDVLAHALAGLTIQLEATTALIEHDAPRDEVLARVRRAHELAREGLRETRRAVGALRGDSVAVPEAIATLAGEYRSADGDPAALTLTGDRSRLAGEAGLAVLRVVQEGLTNVAKHAPGAEVRIAVDAGEGDRGLVACVENGLAAVPVGGGGGVADTGGGFGVRGMRERAGALGGTLQAGPAGEGWRVELRLPGGVGVPSGAIGEPGGDAGGPA